ncbi:MAG: diacylglycerol kinase family lipid kinase [Chloroflexi bacterium]|nr:diacylglycerol kinase family lipid kinase [Chloroflexota bacterium]
MRTCVIINPTAGHKAGLTTNVFGADDVKELLARHHIDADVYPTEYADHATVLARQAARDGYERVIVAGGDGTIGEAAEALIKTEVVLGVLPLGSVMNVARMLGVPRDLEGAAHVIAEGRIVAMDVGRARTRSHDAHFLEAAGVGIEAGLFAYANQIEHGNWGSLRPLVAFMWRYRPRQVRLRLDGKCQRFSAMMVTVANGPYVGAALTLAPNARIDDRQLDVEIFTNFSKLELARYAVRIVGGRRAYNPKVISQRGRTIEIDACPPMLVHADSRPLGTTPACFEVVPKALRVYVGSEAARVSDGAGSVSPAPN